MRLEYEIAAVGLPQLKSVLRGAEQEIVASGRRMDVVMSRRTGRAPGARPANGNASAAEAQRILQAQEREASKSLKKQTRDEERSGRERVKNERFVLGQQAKERDKHQRAEEKAQAFRIRENEKEARAKSKSAERDFNKKKRLRDQEEKTLRRTRESFGRGVASSVAGNTGKVVGIGGTILAGLGGFAAMGAIDRSMDLEAQVGQIVRSASVNKRGTTGAQLEKTVTDVGMAHGMFGTEIASGLDSFIQKGGDLDAGIDILNELADVAAMTGAKLEDLGLTAGDAYAKLGDVEKTKDVIRSLGAQGRAGALDIRDLGQYGPRLTASAGAFKGDLVSNIKTMGGLAQLAIKTGSAAGAAEATESVASIGLDIGEHADEFQAKGIKIWADKDKQKLLPAQDIIANTLMATKGNYADTMGLFGRRAGKMVEGARQTFIKAGGGKTGKAAVLGEIAELSGATLSDKDLSSGVAAKNAEKRSQLTKTSEEFRVAVTEQLLPVITKLIPEMTNLIPTVASVAKVFADVASLAVSHPFAAVIAAISAGVVKDLAAAKIGDLVGGFFKRALGGGKPGETPGAVPTPGGGGKLVPALAAGAAGYGLGSLLANDVYDPALNGKDRAAGHLFSVGMNTQSVIGALQSGRIKPEEAQQFLGNLKGEQKNAKLNSGVGDLVNAVLGPGSLSKFAENNTLGSSPELQKAIDDLTAALQARQEKDDPLAKLNKSADLLAAKFDALSGGQKPDPNRGSTPLVRTQ